MIVAELIEWLSGQDPNSPVRISGISLSGESITEYDISFGTGQGPSDDLDEVWIGWSDTPAAEALYRLRGDLRDVALEEGWSEEMASQLVGVAIRRWRSFDRRSKPNKRTDELRVLDLVKGLRHGSGIDPLYIGPGEFERLGRRFGALLVHGG